MSSDTTHKPDLKTYKIVWLRRWRWGKHPVETVRASRMHVRDDGIVVFYRCDSSIHGALGYPVYFLSHGNWHSIREETI